ncbi:hypothetical protein HOC01_02045 [archaeon]|nr:hypothetical protein [archaeon]MBT6697898.1 hypothetical protein [archaeon]
MTQHPHVEYLQTLAEQIRSESLNSDGSVNLGGPLSWAHLPFLEARKATDPNIATDAIAKPLDWQVEDPMHPLLYGEEYNRRGTGYDSGCYASVNFFFTTICKICSSWTRSRFFT